MKKEEQLMKRRNIEEEKDENSTVTSPESPETKVAK